MCGISLPAGLRLADRLAEPIFTPSTKAEVGHDENISFDEVVRRIGGNVAESLRSALAARSTRRPRHTPRSKA